MVRMGIFSANEKERRLLGTSEAGFGIYGRQKLIPVPEGLFRAVLLLKKLEIRPSAPDKHSIAGSQTQIMSVSGNVTSKKTVLTSSWIIEHLF